MSDVDELVDRLAILELTARYADLADHHDWAGMTALFTPTAVFEAEAVYGRSWTGQAEILDFYENAPRASGHHPTGVHTTFLDPARAHTRLKMLVLFSRAIFTVDYDLTVAKVDGEWRIDRLGLLVVGRTELPSAGGERSGS